MGKCSECAHFAPVNMPKSGVCTRYPPSPLMIPPAVLGGQMQLMAVFPQLSPDSCCGEFRDICIVEKDVAA